MKTIKIPYHKTSMELHIDDKNLAVLANARTDEHIVDKSEKELVLDALNHPVGSPLLSELARGREKVVVVTSDHTRAMPGKLTLPILLDEIRRGNPKADITILIATGLHRATTEEEQRQMFGDDIVDNEKITVNMAYCEENFEKVCELPSGAEMFVNKLAVQCDLLVTEGFIEPHFFAGFSGGRKSILPGICNAATVKENHSYKAIASPYAAAGILDNNPIHEDMLYGAKAVNVQFILNVALDSNKKIIAAFAGDLEKAHAEGTKFVASLAQYPAIQCDISVTSNGGYPLDQNLYQSPKAIATAEAFTKEGGIIIMSCSCCDGMGGEYFEKLIISGTPDEIDKRLSAIPAKETVPEQWCVQIYVRILKRNKVILVTSFLSHESVHKANMIPASSLDEAMQIAYELKGKDAKVAVIPDGVAILAVKNDSNCL